MRQRLGNATSEMLGGVFSEDLLCGHDYEMYDTCAGGSIDC